MPSIRSTSIAAAIAGMLIVGGCANQPPSPAPMTTTVADAALLQRADTLLRKASTAQTVGVQIAPQQAIVGQAVGVEIASNAPGYLYLFQIGTDGRTLNMVFPNAVDGTNLLPGGAPVMLPRPNWRLTARGPAGIGYLLAVVAQQPQDLMQLTSQAQAGQFAIVGTYGAGMATLKETAQ